MPGKTREIKSRMKAVGNIKRITKTMQTIATVRFQAAIKRTTAAQPYTQKITELVSEMAARTEGVSHPLLREADASTKTGKELLLVIGSDRGLCGAYNANLLREFNQHLRANPDSEFEVEVVGKKPMNFIKFNKIAYSAYHNHIGDSPTFEQVEPLAESYMDRFSAGEFDAVRVASTAFESMSRQSARIMQLLPLSNPTSDNAEAAVSSGRGQVDYEFSPEPAELLSQLLPVSVKVRLFQAFNEAVVSEQISRMVAMKAATDAAGKMGKSLRRDYNRARQATITTELTEIIGGSAGLG